MTTEKQEQSFGQDEADRLLMAGWAQGSVFRPNEHISIPKHLVREDMYLVVCTQSCTLVSSNIIKDPTVEVIAAKAIASYSAKSEPATGKEVRRYHLLVEGVHFSALEIDINARFTIPREQLVLFPPDGPKTNSEGRRAFAGWLGRYYTRIALPNELVIRLKRSVFDPLGRFLKSSPKGGGAKNHEGVHSIYLQWQPDLEVDANTLYDIDFLLLCDEPQIAEALEAKLHEIGLDPDKRVEKDGISVNCTVQARGETILTDLDGWTRLTEWDYLTGLAEAAMMPE